MDQDGIEFSSGAENIAAGQQNAAYVHFAWMNSLGHRENILRNIERLGVGVHFGGEMHTYYTQKFITP